MLGIRYLKTSSTTYVLQTRGGRVVREGAGLSFFYFAPATNIAHVPISSVDVPFAFTEITSDFQEVVVQGSLTYRVVEPAQLATLLDYTVDVRGHYVSDDPSKLGERLVHVAQTGARRYIQTLPLREILVSFATLAEAVTAALTASTTVTRLGVEVLDVAISAIKPDPEMSRALQADAREQLLKQADEAIYARRNTAVELERRIREAELQTENAVAQRQREIRQTQMDAEIAVEQQRRQLVDTRVENERKEAEARGSALKAVLDPVRDIDWRTLLAMQGNADAATLISSAFDQLAQGAERIGNLNISPELLETLTNRHRK